MDSGKVQGRRMTEYLRDGRAPVPESETTSRVMSANKGKDTGPERRLRNALKSVGLPGYRLHWREASGRPDIAYPGKGIAIFVHGCYWHHCPHCDLALPKSNRDFWEQKFRRNVERDSVKTSNLEDHGWKVFIFWECEVKENAHRCAEKVKAHVMKNVLSNR